MAEDTLLFEWTANATGVLVAIEEVDAQLSALEERLMAFGEAAMNLEVIAENVDTLAGSAANAAGATEGLDASLSGVDAAASAAAGTVSELSAAQGELAASAGEASAALEAEGAAGAAAAGGTAAPAAAATAAATKGMGHVKMLALGVAAAGAAFIYFGNEAEKSLTIVNALTGATAQEQQYYAEQTQAMSEKYGMSLKETADGLYYVASAGFRGSDAMKVLAPAMQDALAGGADLARVTDAMTSALNAYGLSASSATHISDVMLQAVTDGKQSFSDFARAIGLAAVTGHGAGFAFEEVAAAEATLTQSGLPARRATMDLDHMMNTIGLSIPRVAEQARKLGFAFDEQKYASMSLIEKLVYLEQITNGNKGAFEKLVGGAPGLAAAEILLAQKADGTGRAYDQVYKDMSHASDGAGATANAFKIHSESMSSAIEHMTANASVFAYQLQQAMKPAIVTLLHGIALAFEFLGNMIRDHANIAIPVIIALAAVITGVLVAAMAAWVGGALAAAGAMLPIIGPIFLFIAGVVAAGMAIKAAWQQAQDKTSQFGQAIKPLFDMVGGAFTWFKNLVMGELLPALQQTGIGLDQLKVVGMVLLGVVIAPLIISFAAVVGAIMAAVFVVTKLVEAWNWARNAGGALFSGLGTWANTMVIVVGSAFNALSTRVHDVFTAIGNFFPWLYQHNTYVQRLVDAVVTHFNEAKRKGEEIWRAVTTTVQTALTLAHQAVMDAGKKISATIEGWKAALTAPVDHATHAVIDPIVGIGPMLLKAGANALQMFIDGFKSKVGDLEKAAKDAAGSIGKFLGFHSPTEEGPGAQAHTWAPNLMRMLSSGIDAHVGSLGASASRAAGQVATGYGSGGGNGALMSALLAALTGARGNTTTVGGLTLNAYGVPSSGLDSIVQQMMASRDTRANLELRRPGGLRRPGWIGG